MGEKDYLRNRIERLRGKIMVDKTVFQSICDHNSVYAVHIRTAGKYRIEIATCAKCAARVQRKFERDMPLGDRYNVPWMLS